MLWSGRPGSVAVTNVHFGVRQARQQVEWGLPIFSKTDATPRLQSRWLSTLLLLEHGQNGEVWALGSHAHWTRPVCKKHSQNTYYMPTARLRAFHEASHFAFKTTQRILCIMSISIYQWRKWGYERLAPRFSSQSQVVQHQSTHLPIPHTASSATPVKTGMAADMILPG